MIKAEGLSMHYGPVQALKEVSLEVGQGEIVGLLGPNGAGKSTTMKILTTYLYPSGGKATVGGVDVLDNPWEARRKIGYLPEILPLYMDMEVKEYLEFVGKARGLSGATLKKRMAAVVEECGLARMFRKVIRELSKGYKQRTGLAQALIHDPEIIILDEPTSGLDPHQIVEIRALIRRLAEGKTVMLSTHILQEVEASADRIVIISQGQIIAQGSCAELRERAQEDGRFEVAVAGDRGDIERQLSGLSGTRRVVYKGTVENYHRFRLFTGVTTELWREVNELARNKQWDLREFKECPLTLEETFLTLTEKVAGKKSQGGAA